MSEQDKVSERMKAINKAVAEKTAKPKKELNVSCPVDPAERALCDGCQ
jgi:hypothetical protein